jgi:hypothetical protein
MHKECKKPSVYSIFIGGRDPESLPPAPPSPPNSSSAGGRRVLVGGSDVEIVDEMMTSSSRKSSAAKAEKKRGSALSLHTFQASGGLWPMDQISIKTPNPKCRLFLKIVQ